MYRPRVCIYSCVCVCLAAASQQVHSHNFTSECVAARMFVRDAAALQQQRHGGCVIRGGVLLESGMCLKHHWH
jgi:hypothetical protein